MPQHVFDYPIRCTDAAHAGSLPIVAWLRGTNEAPFVQRHLPGTDEDGTPTRSGSIGRMLDDSHLTPLNFGEISRTARATASGSAAGSEIHRRAQEHREEARASYTIPCACGVNAAIRQERLNQLAGSLLDVDLPEDAEGDVYLPLIVLGT